MGMNVDIYRGKKQKIIDKTIEYCPTADRKLVEEILDLFGFSDSITGDDYFVLNDEHAEDYNPYFSLIDVMDQMFPIAGEHEWINYWQTKVAHETMARITDMYQDRWDVCEKYGIEYKEED